MSTRDRSCASVFYDADCPICVNFARRFERTLGRRRLALVALQTPGAAATLGVRDERLLDEMRLRLQDGKVFGGAAAVAEIARRIWWAWPLWALSRLPGAMRPMRETYRWIASRRGCTSGACGMKAQAAVTPIAFLPFLILPAVVGLFRSWMPPWGFMCAMACALYAGCKWLTYREARTPGLPVDRLRALGYLFAWPGMDARAFLYGTDRVVRPSRSEWIAAVLKTVLGATLTWVIARAALPGYPLVAGWVAMVGLVFVLHFGTFHLLSLFWRRLGVNAMPIMRNPLRSASLADLWGRRWNTAFHELAVQFSFRPLRPTVGVAGATLLVFFVSGLIHELVISLPAHSGYGLPTAYFVLQGFGVASERTRQGRRLGLGRGWRGRLFAVLLAAGPAFWLFPPSFVRNIILPILVVIGAS